MKIWIVYDTLYGNTEQIAQTIKEGMGKGNEVELVKADKANFQDIAKVDMLLVGSPTHGGWFTEPVKKFLHSIPQMGLQGKRAAAYDTSTSKENESGFVKLVIDFFGCASKRIAKELNKKGTKLLTSETFFVIGKEGPIQDGEMERAKAWAKGLVE